VVGLLRAPSPPPRTKVVRAEEEYDEDKPCIYDLEVDGPEVTDIGLVDEDGLSIMRSPDPIGFL
jgi:hypothetical protein